MAECVSILIPAYNHARFITETVQSLLDQTYPNIELIVVDDGSTDATFQTLIALKPQCEARFTRVHMETKPNEGTCKTLNRLISLARGDYISIIASDDLFLPNAIETEVNFLRQHPDYVLTVGDNILINNDSKRIGWTEARTSAPLQEATFKTFGSYLQHIRQDVDFHAAVFGTYETFVKGNYIPNGYLIRAEALRACGKFTPEAPLEDWWMHLQLSKRGKFHYIDEPLFAYRWHDTNTSHRLEHMRKMTRKTKLHEYAHICRLPDTQWRERFEAITFSYKLKCDLGFLKVYKQKNLMHKRFILSFFGKKISLKSKPLPE